ncbi:TPA: hypothetical protein NY126_005712 [Escherichia coli]|uniref:Uncharacterized protein n=2 Tax=Escherichia coli TaxID=562 RepID=A0A2I6FN63_ECOLX|nr:hypothetical protein [Escherichia coli]EFA8193115.1 hypothetical protein [Escherichia coli O157]AEE59979.1 conserved hypothetical protein [Escherichia coli UMNK88]AUK04237.1 hypothetical protein CR538_28790 [Escherichia coli]AWU47993.1 hypothetical protein [Escherichia coli]AXO10240.1 hypothetical protein DS732_29185 [Escherichia coli]
MSDSALLRNSSLFIAYMGCLGWGSAYFYGWGTSFYYGFPWWVVGAGVDDVARSLFYAVTVIVVFLIGWGTGIVFFLGVKQKNNMQSLSFFRLFLAILLLFVSPALEFSVIHQHFAPYTLTLCVIAALIITLLVRMGVGFISVKCISEVSFIRQYRIECVLLGFIIYFWLFSFIAGWYKPQFKKEYQTLRYENAWYYVLARYDERLILSKSYLNGSKKFVVLNSANTDGFEINIVRVL